MNKSTCFHVSFPHQLSVFGRTRISEIKAEFPNLKFESDSETWENFKQRIEEIGVSTTQRFTQNCLICEVHHRRIH